MVQLLRVGPSMKPNTYTILILSAEVVSIFKSSFKITLFPACALLSIDQVSKFISDNPIPFTIVGAVVGLAVAVLGLKLFLPTLFITGFASGFFVALVIKILLVLEY